MQPGGQSNLWQPNGEAPLPAPSSTAPDLDPSSAVSWQASEYVHHEKERRWFIPLFAGAFLLLVVAIFLIQSLTFSLLIVVMTIALAVYAVRPPRIMNYQLTASSIHINDKTFLLHDFRAFGIVQDGPLNSAVLIPNKRFMPAVTLYFPAENGEAIVDLLGSRLPMSAVEPDSIDRLMGRLRF